MASNRVFIQAAEQISIQQPLSEIWMESPVYYGDGFVKAVNPPFRDYLAAGETRRMGNLMKRALVTTLKVLRETGTEHPDAVITGTSIGSLDYTERFLDAMTENGEEALSPTYFMQSTHNTVGSTLGIYTKTDGYNTTYSHGAMSFDLAVQDAWMQMTLGDVTTALVGGHDEMVESYFELLKKTGYVGVENMAPCGEVAMSMLMTLDDSVDHLCELAGVSICHHYSFDQLKSLVGQMLEKAGLALKDVDAVLTGVNGNPSNDIYYYQMMDAVFPDLPLLRYKHLFGENYTAPALGIYAMAHCIGKGCLPSHLMDDTRPYGCDSLRNVIIVNQMKGKECSFILLRKS